MGSQTLWYSISKIKGSRKLPAVTAVIFTNLHARKSQPEVRGLFLSHRQRIISPNRLWGSLLNRRNRFLSQSCFVPLPTSIICKSSYTSCLRLRSLFAAHSLLALRWGQRHLFVKTTSHEGQLTIFLYGRRYMHVRRWAVHVWWRLVRLGAPSSCSD